jgi:hypothetical protein
MMLVVAFFLSLLCNALLYFCDPSIRRRSKRGKGR